jgi:hypothetical protein
MIFCTSGGDKMGLFGGVSEQQKQNDELIQKQYQENQAEIAEKKKSLYNERLDIIKSQGNQSWHPNKTVSKPKLSFKKFKGLK